MAESPSEVLDEQADRGFWVCCPNLATMYGRWNWGPWDYDRISEQLDNPQVPIRCTLEAVVKDITDRYHGNDSWIYRRRRPGRKAGWGERDIAVWRRGRLMATIVRADDGSPRVAMYAPRSTAYDDD